MRENRGGRERERGGEGDQKRTVVEWGEGGDERGTTDGEFRGSRSRGKERGERRTGERPGRQLVRFS